MHSLRRAVATSLSHSSRRFASTKTVADLAKSVPLAGRTVLVRADLNPPFSKGDGPPTITDDTRIREAMPTVKLLAEEGAKVVLCSHLGRPKKAKTPEEKERLRLAPVAARISELLGKDIQSVKDCIGEEVKAAAAGLQNGELLLLENTRFYGEEEKNEAGFAKQLVADSGATIYVNDAFGAAHRAHASTAGVAAHTEHAVAGLLLNKELQFLNNAVLGTNKQRPLVSIVGGSKVSTKLPVLKSLLENSDTVIVGGAMAFTFVKAMGGKVGSSMVEEDQLGLALELMETAKKLGVDLLLPSDAVTAAKVDASATTSVCAVDQIPDGQLGLDIGPATIDSWQAVLKGAKTVLWNGPMGVFEMAPFAKGTFAIAETMAKLTPEGVVTIVGGGDSVAAVGQAGLKAELSHVSTGGGASLELLEGKTLPGVAALDTT